MDREPNDPAAEALTLGCLIMAGEDADPSRLDECFEQCRRCRIVAEAFYDVRHREIFQAIDDRYDNGLPVTMLFLVQHLRQANRLEAAGGIVYVTDLLTSRDRPACIGQLDDVLPIVVEKWHLRIVGELGRAALSATNGEAAEVLARLRHFSDSINVSVPSTGRTWRVDELSEFDITHDPDALIGVRDDGSTSRYLGRGGSAWLIGPSGVGKSSLTIQMACCLAIGRRMFGIRPVRPLRVSIIQAENDKGDTAEMIQGVQTGLRLTAEERLMVNENLRMHTESTMTGRRFCEYMRTKLKQDASEVVFVDPLLSFAGIDVSRQEQCSQFLRTGLNPVLHSTGALLIAAHHTGKPPQERSAKNWRTTDWLYHFLGSSELVNWARASMLLEKVDDAGHFRLRLTKRGQRAGATHPDSTPTEILWLRQSRSGICWEQIDPPAQPEPSAAKGKALTKPEQVQGMNTASFIARCTQDGESLRGIAERLSHWCTSKEAAKKIDLGKGTAVRAIMLLLESGKLESRDGLYFMGPNA